jgi:pimeloyl-ACP methyl ester carboxylesterase
MLAQTVAGAMVLLLVLVIVVVAVYVGLIEWRYSAEVARMLRQAPVFRPLRGEPDPGGEEVRFRTEDGLQLAGTYYRALTDRRRGVVVFCHEFLGDRHGAYEYVGALREEGFDLFAYDSRNHGDSDAEPGYEVIHWVSDREVRDLRAALAYLRSRPDRDPAGVALFGVSRGGGTALCVAGEDPTVWAVVTDGAFPTAITMLHHIRRRAVILIHEVTARLMPRVAFEYVVWSVRRRLERQLGRRFPSIERAVKRIPPRPWLAIHGGSDGYIEPGVLEELVRAADGAGSVTVWLVAGAKHNQCREVAGEEYRRRVAEFLRSAAPRRIVEDATEVAGSAVAESGRPEVEAVAARG